MLRLLAAVVRWSLHNRVIVLVATGFFLVAGVRAAVTLPIDAVPDITNEQLQIITSAPALSPVELEQFVTVPVERALAGVPRATEVRSLTKYGISVVTVVFEEGTDLYRARQLVSERLQAARETVALQYGTPQLGPISTGLGEVFQFALRNDALDQRALHELMTWYVAPQLRMVKGIVEVSSFGGRERQYEVVLEPGRLQATGVSVGEVVAALERANANTGGGYIERNREHFVIGTDGLLKSLDDVARVVVATTPEGVPLTVGSLGEVRFGSKLRRGAATKDGEGEVVVGVALMLMGENSRTVTEAVKARLKELEPTLPPGTRIEPFYDRAAMVDRTIATVGTNLLEGALLVVLVLFLLLGDLRAGAVVAVTIPLSLLFAVGVMNAFGLSGNLMSLGAIDFGLLVDGAVIIVENAVRRLGERQRLASAPLTPGERVEVVEQAALEVRAASLFGEAIIAIVYLPVLSLLGTEGRLFRPMAITVLLALLGAFILSLTLVPVLTSLWVTPSRAHRETWLLRQAHRLYRPLFASAMRRRGVTVGLGVASLAAAVALFARLGAEFVPTLDEGDLLIEARRLTGAALSETVRTDLQLEREIRSLPEVAQVVARVGSSEVGTDPMSIEQSDVYIELKPRAQWRPGVDKAALAAELEALLARVPEVGGAISQPIQMRNNELMAGIRSDVGVLIYGEDLDELARLGADVAAAVRGVPGAVDVRAEQVAGLQYLRVTPDRDKLARYGLSVADVNLVAQSLSVGAPAGTVLERERRFNLVVKSAHRFDGELDALRALPLETLSGQLVPLGEVADLALVSGPAQISRERQSRRLTVEFNVRGRDLLSVVRDAQAAVAKVELPVGYRAEWGGQFRHYLEARARLLVVVPLALALILFLLWLTFGSMRAGLLIFLNVPFAVVGGVVGLWARGIPFSISAGVGFIALFGVAVLNGLVLVAFARDLESSGLGADEAIARAAEGRLRPVLMTALVASLGFLPMALSTDPGAEVQRPLATVVIGGVLTATLLTLFVLPALYEVWMRGRARR